ncbi:MAG: regulatory protein GemA, partial [Burkholderiaceae bacterium]
ADALRKAELAKIHIGRQRLGLADDEYRSILLSVTGKQSAGDLDWRGRQQLLDHFRKLGFKPAAKTAKRPAPDAAIDRDALIGKIAAQLTAAQLPWSYADGMAKRICKVDRIEFCLPEHLAKIVAALEYDARRRARRAE